MIAGREGPCALPGPPDAIQSDGRIRLPDVGQAFQPAMICAFGTGRLESLPHKTASANEVFDVCALVHNVDMGAMMTCSRPRYQSKSGAFITHGEMQ